MVHGAAAAVIASAALRLAFGPALSVGEALASALVALGYARWRDPRCVASWSLVLMFSGVFLAFVTSRATVDGEFAATRALGTLGGLLLTVGGAPTARALPGGPGPLADVLAPGMPRPTLEVPALGAAIATVPGARELPAGARGGRLLQRCRVFTAPLGALRMRIAVDEGGIVRGLTFPTWGYVRPGEVDGGPLVEARRVAVIGWLLARYGVPGVFSEGAAHQNGRGWVFLTADRSRVAWYDAEDAFLVFDASFPLDGGDAGEATQGADVEAEDEER